jgi:hypothetical protein
MKRILLLFSLCIALRSSSFGQEQDTLTHKDYEFMTIISEFPGRQVFLVYITEPGGKYQKLKFEGPKKYNYGETTVIIDLLEKYSKQGWLLQNSNMTVQNDIYYFYYLLYRRKSDLNKIEIQNN